MNFPGVRRFTYKVKRVTGYGVALNTNEGITDDAQMILARTELPADFIRVYRNRLPYADWIVAVRCAMRGGIFCKARNKIQELRSC